MIKMGSLRFLREPLVNLDKKSAFKMVATMLIQDVYYGIRFNGGTWTWRFKDFYKTFFKMIIICEKYTSILKNASKFKLGF